tara:strand:+ start:368 stop:607 length:240 start_codon:yes stop_codon:yes gene_type:complete
MKLILEKEIDKKYQYLMNLVPDARKKTKLPYSVEILDKQLVSLENSLKDIPKTNKKDIRTITDRIMDIKSSITILIIGT